MAGQVEHVPVGRAREPVAPPPWCLDAMRLLGVLLTAAWSRRPIRPRADEAVRPLPGDELVADAKGRWNHAVTIRARPAFVDGVLKVLSARRISILAGGLSASRSGRRSRFCSLV